MTRIYLLPLIILFNFSCKNKNSNSSGETNVRVWVADSIRIDYLGNLGVFDYDPASGLFLGRNNAKEEIILFDDAGEIRHQYVMLSEGPNSITWATGIGFLDGQVCILDRKKGIMTFTPDGVISRVISVPNEYYHINGVSFAAHKMGNELAYIKPMREDFDVSNWSDTYRIVYKSPIIELLEPNSGSIRSTMSFPPNTVYESGNYYHWTFPAVVKNEKEWLLYMLAERKYHVYREEEGEIEYKKSIEIPIKDAIDIKGVPLSSIEDIYETSRFNVFGKIEQLYHRGTDILVIYTKGVPEELVKQQNHEDPIQWMQFIHSIPRYLAVFNQNHKLIQKDLHLPEHLTFSSVLNGEGEIVAIKNQESLGVEEDWVTLYKLRVAETE